MLELENAIRKSKFKITTVLSGTARGADRLGEQWAEKNGIPVEHYPADWNGPHGKAAGFKRNDLMASKADALIALWDMQSKGTEHMIITAGDHKLKKYIEFIL
jgi:hypothetical protein